MRKEESAKPKRQGLAVAGHAAFFAGVMLTVSAAMVMGAVDFAIPDSISLIEGGKVGITVEVSDTQEGISAGTPDIGKGKVGDEDEKSDTNAKAMVGNVAVKNVSVKVYPDTRLVPCGSIFGVKFFTKGVLVVGTGEIETAEGKINPAQKAGLREADTILKINGIEVNTVEDAAMIIENARGAVLPIEFERDGSRYETSLLPALALSGSGSKYKSGLWIRDSTAGIGTVTYYDPETGMFGGLGHGICDIDTGKLMPLLRATVVDISLNDVIKGEHGRPGELKGSFGSYSRGRLISNTSLGVYGFLDSPPYDTSGAPEALPVALSEDIKPGEAQIYSTVDADGVKAYSIEITKVYKNDGSNKNFIFEVKDESLISSTGGIVQGMSGSPVIQDGKLIGAVTHVMINDPQKGYGVFIENMLNAANIPQARAS